jgi:hypothetical protein
MQQEGGLPSGGAVSVISLAVLTLLIAVSCAGTGPAALELPVQPVPATAAPAPEELLLYLPIESVTLLPAGGTELHERMLELRFDRPGAWSINPERFVFSTREARRLTPIQTYGSGRLSRADILVLRIASERAPGYHAAASGGDFFSSGRTPADVPEALVLIDPALLSRSLYLTVPGGSRIERQGIRSLAMLREEAAAAQLDELTEREKSLIDAILSLGSAAGSRRGYRSILFIPRKALVIADYPHGLDLRLGLSAGFPSEGGGGTGQSDAFEIALVPRLSKDNPFPDVRIGDLGVFSGATPLLDPGLPEISADLYRSDTLVKIGESTLLFPSPVLFEGSFNAYRDERRRFLFYPGVFSYIPGKHPDLSPSDVDKVSGYDPGELDRLLRGRSLLTMRHDIYGAIPAFIAASESPTELEIAYRQDPRLRDKLREFYLEPAFILWLD